jgi:hypothetical protein
MRQPPKIVTRPLTSRKPVLTGHLLQPVLRLPPSPPRPKIPALPPPPNLHLQKRLIIKLTAKLTTQPIKDKQTTSQWENG